MLLFFFVLALVIFSFQWIYNKKNRKKGLELLLISIVVFCMGFTGIGNFIGHIFYPNKIASLIGWGPSPFQFEVGIANLAVGVLAILSFWFRGPFLFAAILANTIWMWGDAWSFCIHSGKLSSGSAGVYFWSDVLIPLLVLFFYWQREKRAH